jgi:hypothetical protein
VLLVLLLLGGLRVETCQRCAHLLIQGCVASVLQLAR